MKGLRAVSIGAQPLFSFAVPSSAARQADSPMTAMRSGRGLRRPPPG
ncbi:hypothetical protein OH687_31330 [Burkholderia anthina]|nr:hypothetical protein OH687_31330 [Burkholderia anthina]